MPGVAEAVGLVDRVRRTIGDQIGGALVGESPFDASLETVLGGLARKVDLLREPISIEPLASTETVRATGSTPADVPSSDEALSINLDALLEKVNFSELDLSVQNASSSGKTLELGNGQSIQFGDDSDLSVEGILDNFTIRGMARLDSTTLGGESLVASGGWACRGSGSGLEDVNGDPRFELQLSELQRGSGAQRDDWRAGQPD